MPGTTDDADQAERMRELGGAIARVVPEIWIHRVAGVGFIVMGVLFLAGKG